MKHIDIYEQELFGRFQWRVMRRDGQRIFGRLQTDFPTCEEAMAAVRQDFRRNELGPVDISIHLMGGLSVITVTYDDSISPSEETV